jgi:hypothetical protein
LIFVSYSAICVCFFIMWFIFVFVLFPILFGFSGWPHCVRYCPQEMQVRHCAFVWGAHRFILSNTVRQNQITVARVFVWWFVRVWCSSVLFVCVSSFFQNYHLDSLFTT